MQKSKMLSLSATLIGSALLLGLGFALSYKAQARTMAMNSMELMQRVIRNNAGWDYIPRCSSEAYWDIDDNRCEKGEPDGDSYGIMNEAQLMQKVHEVNAGWDWVPRCGDGARWDEKDMRCEKGAG